MGEQNGPALDPAAVAGGAGAFLSHGDALDGHAAELGKLTDLRAAFAGTAAVHWPQVAAGLTGATEHLQGLGQQYVELGGVLRGTADGLSALDVASSRQLRTD